jgi:hypothetical protein
MSGRISRLCFSLCLTRIEGNLALDLLSSFSGSFTFTIGIIFSGAALNFELIGFKLRYLRNPFAPEGTMFVEITVISGFDYLDSDLYNDYLLFADCLDREESRLI